MYAGFQIEGLDDLRHSLGLFRDEFDELVVEEAPDALEPIVSLEKEYPDQKPPKNPNRIYIRGQGTLYVPTGHIQPTSENYGPSIKSYAALEGNSPVGYVEAPASYSSYLRGDPPAYEFGATLHRDNWMQLSALLDKGVPQVIDALDERLSIRIGRYFP